MTRGEGAAVGMHWGLQALMHNGYGQYDKALGCAHRGCEYEEVMAYNVSLAELVEAAARSGQTEDAVSAYDRLCERTQAAGTAWALGVEARSPRLAPRRRSCVSGVDRPAHAEPGHGRARAQPAGVRRVAPPREPSRRRARAAPRRARELQRHGRRGVRRAGAARAPRHGRDRAHGSPPTTGTRSRPQELQVARLARDGYTNPEIGAQLFISPRTVEYHLRKVFRKLDVTSRRGLRDALDDSTHQAVQGYV